MNTLVIDFETYFDKDYSLKKMPTIEYVRDPRFMVYGAAIKWNNDPARWATSAELEFEFAHLNTRNKLLISHNSLFDHLILKERYDLPLHHQADTLALARALLPNDLDFDLDRLLKLFGFEGKHNDGKALQAVKGDRNPSPQKLADLAEYAIQDAEGTYKLFQAMWNSLPEPERELMNLTLRMGTHGKLLFNQERSEEALAEALAERQQHIAAAGVPITVLRSSDQFAEALVTRGITPPRKISAKTGKETWAFSKSDRAFLDLLDDPEAALLVQGRLAAMSNSEPTRIRRLQRITSLSPNTLPMPLNYCGAHTTRWSGAGKINVQNLKRNSKLRRSIEAPDGYVIHVGDSAQIELRFNMWFCDEVRILNILRDKGDVYRMSAAPYFGITPDEVTKDQRQFGKVMELGSGYQMGHKKFRAVCALGPMGNDPIFLSTAEAQRAIELYRQGHPNVQNKWYWLSNTAIPLMAGKSPVEHKAITFEHEAVLLPSGLRLQYPNLRFRTDPENGDGWVFGCNGVTRKIYGGKLLENIIQALSRVVIGEQILACQAQIPGFEVVSMTHDEIIAIGPEDRAEEHSKMMFDIMSQSPTWAPDVPLSAEVGYAKEYSK